MIIIIISNNDPETNENKFFLVEKRSCIFTK